MGAYLCSYICAYLYSPICNNIWWEFPALISICGKTVFRGGGGRAPTLVEVWHAQKYILCNPNSQGWRKMHFAEPIRSQTIWKVCKTLDPLEPNVLLRLKHMLFSFTSSTIFQHPLAST